ncbi:hypothetical protein L9F63_025584, partial [Diploptera punctata]
GGGIGVMGVFTLVVLWRCVCDWALRLAGSVSSLILTLKMSGVLLVLSSGSYVICVCKYVVDLQLIFGIDVSGVYDDWWEPVDFVVRSSWEYSLHLRVQRIGLALTSVFCPIP